MLAGPGVTPASPFLEADSTHDCGGASSGLEIKIAIESHSTPPAALHTSQSTEKELSP